MELTEMQLTMWADSMGHEDILVQPHPTHGHNSIYPLSPKLMGMGGYPSPPPIPLGLAFLLTWLCPPV